MKKVVFIIPPQVELLDLAGPVQVFTEARFQGLEIHLEFYSFQSNTVSSAGLPFGKISNYKNAKLSKGDFLFIPGIHFESLEKHLVKEKMFFQQQYIIDHCLNRVGNQYGRKFQQITKLLLDYN